MSTDDWAIVIEENGVRLRLNIVDTPGYGDQVNNDRWYEKIPMGAPNVPIYNFHIL